MRERIFNRMRRQLFRKRIGLPEIAGSLAALAVLAAAVAWVASRRDAYDPAERDVSFAVLEQQSVPDRLYQRPLQAWVEPGRAGPAAGPSLGAFPPAILAGGWVLGTRLQQFDPDTLYVKIDGAAEQYLRFGFKQLHYVGLRREGGPEEIGIELYDQGDFSGGLGIFSAQRDPAKPVRRAGELTYYETSVGAIGVMGRWFFKLAGNAESAPIRDKSRQLVEALATLPLQRGEVPFGFRVMAGGLALPFEDVAYQPVNVFQFDFAKDFWFGRLPGEKQARWFLHRATGADVAAELYERLLTEQRFDYETVSEQEQRTVLRHRFLKNWFAMVLDGPMLYGVENAPTQAVLEPALARLAQAVRDAGEQ
jgi:hypothetical protein